ncbi:hypothetical protein VTO42DRAFT_8402 [Malbranchea cinnamomea]
MPFFRVRVLIPVLALLITTVFFLGIDRYDRASLDRLTQPLHQSPKPKSPPARQTGPQQQQPQSENQQQQQGSPEQCNLNGANLTPPLFTMTELLHRKNYTRIYMRPKLVDSDTKLPSLETLDGQVLPEFQVLDGGVNVLQPDQINPGECPRVIEVDIAAEHDVEETSQILFGMATTIDRLKQQLPALLFSYGHTKASILVLLPDDTQDVAGHERYFRERGLDITLKTSPMEFTDRYFGLVEAFTEHIEKNRRHTTWVSFVDDDTFFLSLGRLAKRLAKLDSSKKHYIGALSEAYWQVDTWGHFGFGGAGVFVSKPLLTVLRVAYQKCMETGQQPGDQKLGQCIDKYGDTPLTEWNTLYQMDVHGNADGVFESGREIDTVHHWTSWYHKDVVKMGTVAAAAGRNSLLRRWRFDEKIEKDKDGRELRSFYVMTNGYSIVRYTAEAKFGPDVVNFDATEKTWDEDVSGYEARLGPLRPKDQPEVRKDRFMLLDSIVVGNNVHQLYKHEAPEAHSVIEVVWLPPVSSA